MPPLTNLSRRGLLKGAGALMLGVQLPLAAASPADAARPTIKGRPVAINAWLTIAPDGAVVVRIACTELGQGIFTALAQLVAEELDVDWRIVRAEMAPFDPAYANPMLGGMRSGGSTSIRAFFLPMRQAGAAARLMLLSAASRLWKVPAGELVTENGAVVHPPTDRRAPYGPLARFAARQPVPATPPLRDRADWRLIGKPIARVDAPAKATGRAIFGADIRIPGMLYAAIRHCPVFGGTLARVDESAIRPRGTPDYPSGVVAVVPLRDAVAVVADSWWQARSALARLTVAWTEGAGAGQTSAAIDAALTRALDGRGALAAATGDADAAIRDAARVIEAVYRVPFLAHAALEPLTATADVRADSCDLWVPTQDQDRYVREISDLLGIPARAITITTTFAGGSFGRNLESDVGLEAVRISQAVGKPVQLIWTREEDTRHDVYRPANVARVTVGLDGYGRPLGWRHRVAGPSILGRVRPASIRDGVDEAVLAGIADQPYALPALRLDYVRQDVGVPVGYWRSFGHGANAFAVESMLDEIAAAAGRDPYRFRRGLLAALPRALAVLDLAAEKSGWGKPLPDGADGARRGRGIAFHAAFDSFAAQVAEATVFADGRLKVDRIVAAVDCGTLINPDIVASQIEGGVVFGLGAALSGKITLERGRVVQGNFPELPLPTLADAPRVEVYAVASDAPPGGVSGLAVPPVAPALANAIFSATGRRLRSLPITDHDLRA